MSSESTPTESPLSTRRLTVATAGLLVSVMAVAISGGIFLGRLDARVDSLIEKIDKISPEKIAEYKSELKQTISDEIESTLQFNTLPAGTILASTIDPNELAKIALNWRLADGRPVEPHWTYQGIDGRLPDLQDVFLRGMPENSTRTVGSVQHYATAKPKNENFALKLWPVEDHAHDFERDKGTIPVVRAPEAADSVRFTWREYEETQEAGGHSHKAKVRGWDPETRPNNVAVYFYVRVY